MKPGDLAVVTVKLPDGFNPVGTFLGYVSEYAGEKKAQVLLGSGHIITCESHEAYKHEELDHE